MGEASVDYADRSGDAFQRMGSRTTLADALHQAGEAARAQALFEEAEALQAEWQPQYPRLYSLRGYRYCDLLLAQGRAAEVRERAQQYARMACSATTRPARHRPGSPLPRPGGAGAGRAWRGQGAARPGGRRPAPGGHDRITFLAVCWRARRCSGRPAILWRRGAIWTRRCGSRGAARCGSSSAMPISNTPGSRSRSAIGKRLARISPRRATS